MFKYFNIVHLLFYLIAELNLHHRSIYAGDHYTQSLFQSCSSFGPANKTGIMNMQEEEEESNPSRPHKKQH